MTNCHYHIDLNEDQTQQHPLLFSSLTSQPPSSSSSSSSSPTSTLSYLPFFNPPLDHGGYFHGDHTRVLFQPQEEVKTIVSNSGSCDHLTQKNETRIKLTIRKKENRNYNQSHQMGSKVMKSRTKLSEQNDTGDDQRLRTRDQAYHGFHGDVYKSNKNNNGVIRVCSDCNTTKTPLWRSGPSGPKSLCNACGIRQRKARRAAAMAAAAAAGGEDEPPPPPPLKIKKIKRSMKNQNGENFHVKKKCKITADNSASQNAASSTKFCLDDLAIILSKSSAFQQVFPQDEKEAAILLMAMSYGMVHGGDYRI